MEATIKIGQAAKIIGCHPATLLNYEKRGIISPVRDIYGHRRFKRSDILKMKSIFSATWPDSRPNQKPPDSVVLAAFTGVEKPTSVKASKHIFEIEGKGTE